MNAGRRQHLIDQASFEQLAKSLSDNFLPRLKIPAVVIMPLWFLQDFVGGIDSIRGVEGHVAFWAHVGGFATGFGACRYLRYEIQARREKLEFLAETSLGRFAGIGEGIEAAEKLLEEDPENAEWHLNLARAKTRWRASQEGKEHYEKAIKLLIDSQPEKAAEVFIEYWRKYLNLLEAKYQVRLSLLISKKFDADFSARTLQSLIDNDHSLNVHMEHAYLNLARMYREQIKRDDLARYVYEKFLQRFPDSEHREFVKKALHSLEATPQATEI